MWCADYGDMMDVQPEGYGDRQEFPDLIYIPDDARASTRPAAGLVDARRQGAFDPAAARQGLHDAFGLQGADGETPRRASWRIIGTAGEGTFCHKPCTVSGGGKSEISKSLRDYMLYGPIFVADVEKDLDLVEQIFDRDYSTAGEPTRPRSPTIRKRPSRPILEPGPIARQRDQAADALVGIHRRIQRLAGVDPQLHLPDRLHHQAVLQARVGTGLAAIISAWTSSTDSPATS